MYIDGVSHARPLRFLSLQMTSIRNADAGQMGVVLESALQEEGLGTGALAGLHGELGAARVALGVSV